MIPADRFLLDGNHAWLVVDAHENFPPSPGEMAWAALDRPCDACDGDRFWYDVDGEEYNCEDCRCSGRHTFDIEVVRPIHSHETDDGGWDQLDEITRYRVSIVPGMVLPIHGSHEFAVNVARCEAYVHSTDGLFVHADNKWRGEPITLPPAAAPGMWAVKLRVAS